MAQQVRFFFTRWSADASSGARSDGASAAAGLGLPAESLAAGAGGCVAAAAVACFTDFCCFLGGLAGAAAAAAAAASRAFFSSCSRFACSQATLMTGEVGVGTMAGAGSALALAADEGVVLDLTDDLDEAPAAALVAGLEPLIKKERKKKKKKGGKEKRRQEKGKEKRNRVAKKPKGRK